MTDEEERGVAWAAEVLGLGESVTMNEEKRAFQRLLKRWHPDNCDEDPERCDEKTRDLIEAHEVLEDYFESYQFPLDEDEIDAAERDGEEWWMERFGDDPIWGG
ncbi:MAG: Chaperone protein DnaJ [Methanonatronarchaeales archaeon]|nr:Chaperone protein DnaJ [Methanonatronarchaeales archaeon]